MAQDFNLWQQLMNASDKLGNATLGKWFPLENKTQINYKKLLRENLYSDNGEVNINIVKQLNPKMYESYSRGGIDSKKLAEILQNGNVSSWKDKLNPPVQPLPQQVEVLGANDTTNNAPQNIVGNISKYRYQGKTSKLDNEYLNSLWNEINIQKPNLSNNDKIALFESSIAASFPESHLGADYQNTSRNTNIWNIGYNSSKGSNLKYDPTDSKEMAKYAIQQLTDTFGFLENKGPSRELVFNYVVGPRAAKTPENWAKVDGWINAYNTGLKIIGATQPWGK